VAGQGVGCSAATAKRRAPLAEPLGEREREGEEGEGVFRARARGTCARVCLRQARQTKDRSGVNAASTTREGYVRMRAPARGARGKKDETEASPRALRPPADDAPSADTPTTTAKSRATSLSLSYARARARSLILTLSYKNTTIIKKRRRSRFLSPSITPPPSPAAAAAGGAAKATRPQRPPRLPPSSPLRSSRHPPRWPPPLPP
jgi:hypothetical protein